jgi:hypothetical protein
MSGVSKSALMSRLPPATRVQLKQRLVNVASGKKVATKVAGEKSVAASTTGSMNVKSAAQAAALKQSLALREVRERQAKENGTIIAGGEAKKTFRKAPEFAKKFGGSPQDWVKKTSTSYVDGEGRIHSTHWVENIRTGERKQIRPVIDEKGKGRVKTDE